jgi:hypothetical protein
VTGDDDRDEHGDHLAVAPGLPESDPGKRSEAQKRVFWSLSCFSAQAAML